MNRRSFIKSTAAVTLGGMGLLTAACGSEAGEAQSGPEAGARAEPAAADRALPAIGVQLYTVRSLLEKDFVKTIERVAEIGYDQVEFAGYFDHSPEEVRALLYWIAFAGKDALSYFERYPGRFPLCHVKDMASGKQIVSVGQGDIDFAAIFARSEQAGLQYYFVHDNADDPFQSITASYNHLTQLRF